MRFLIVEDDFASRRVLQVIVSDYGEVDVVVDGDEAIEAFRLAWAEDNPYTVIFLDIMMPRVDGQKALESIRAHEREIGVKASDEVKVVMVSALDDPKSVFRAYGDGGATSYLVKPIDRSRVRDELESIGVLPPNGS